MNSPNGSEMSEGNQVRQKSYRIWIALLGCIITIGGLATELLSFSPGYGAYQIWIIVVGILITMLGISRTENGFFSLIMIILTVVLTLLPLEFISKIYLSLNPAVSNWWQDYIVEDEMLHHRLMPNAIDHDAAGWRNPAVLDSANIVVIGDSQTWGSNVGRDAAWTMQLANNIDDSVYSLAQPGYGVADYYTLFNREAFALNPQQVVIGLYFGNDIFDAALRVYDKEGYGVWRNSQLDANSIQTSIEEISRVVQREREVWNPPNTQQTPSVWLRLRDTTNIGRLLYRLNVLPDFSSGQSLVTVYNNLPPDDPYRLDIYSDDQQTIYFEPAVRNVVMNLETPIIAEGNRLAQALFTEMHRVAAEHNIQLVVVFIPTKELVYTELVQAQHGQLSPAYSELVILENALRHEYLLFLNQLDIPVIDGLIPLKQAARAHEIIYPELDGHPVARGYQVLGQYVAEELEGISARN
jgi:lysophospholipase L1-like esterase